MDRRPDAEQAGSPREDASALPPPQEQRRAKAEAETQAQQSKARQFHVVGIGASAGGLKALGEFFAHVPSNTGLAFVVVVHLSPDYKSQMAKLLQRQSSMPVEQVTQTVALEPNRVYVIPPNANLNTIDTHLRLSELEEKRSERAPIDHFLRTLARTHGERAIGVVLTGTGTDGTRGLRHIQQEGGITLVQDPSEAEYDGMPNSAIAADAADKVLPVREMPSQIMQFAQTAAAMTQSRPHGPVTEHTDILQQIVREVDEIGGLNMDAYSRPTLLGRIHRRMQMNGMDAMADYLDLLRARPQEAHSLANDLLDTVTEFFGNHVGFEELERVIPHLFAAKKPREQLRVWVVGCSTGEEAYSVAILLLEQAEREPSSPDLRILASDLQGQAIRCARDGFYAKTIQIDLSPERMDRFFIEHDGGYRVGDMVRQVVTFAPYDLLWDPPFVQVDLIVCHRVLSRLKESVQQDLLALFHYVLNPGGYLLLGTSDSVNPPPELLRPVTEHVYRRRGRAAGQLRLPVRAHRTERSRRGEGLTNASAAELVTLGEELRRTSQQLAARGERLISIDERLANGQDHGDDPSPKPVAGD